MSFNKKIRCLGFLNFLGKKLNVDYVIYTKFQIFYETVFSVNCIFKHRSKFETKKGLKNF